MLPRHLAFPVIMQCTLAVCISLRGYSDKCGFPVRDMVLCEVSSVFCCRVLRLAKSQTDMTGSCAYLPRDKYFWDVLLLAVCNNVCVYSWRIQFVPVCICMGRHL